MATGALESAATDQATGRRHGVRRKTGGTTMGCEAAVVDPVILVGLIFSFTKSK